MAGADTIQYNTIQYSDRISYELIKGFCLAWKKRKWTNIWLAPMQPLPPLNLHLRPHQVGGTIIKSDTCIKSASSYPHVLPNPSYRVLNWRSGVWSGSWQALTTDQTPSNMALLSSNGMVCLRSTVLHTWTFSSYAGQLLAWKGGQQTDKSSWSFSMTCIIRNRIVVRRCIRKETGSWVGRRPDWVFELAAGNLSHRQGTNLAS